MFTLKNIASMTRELSLTPCRSRSPVSWQLSYSYQGQRQEQKPPRTREEMQHEKDCRTLEVPENCNDEGVVRDAYIKLAKRYHPDSGSPEASSSKFQEIDTAYRNFLKKFADFRHNRHKIEGEYGLYYKEKRKEREADREEEEVETPDIKHTAPQHRQYLSYDGIGSGTPSQREKQHRKWRAMKAVENVLEHRMEQVSKNSGQDIRDLVRDQRAAKKIKTGTGIDRVVEDMIQEAMARGDFDNLSGTGKPLNSANAYNPYIDFTTHKLNQLLIDNGFAPEWILLEKEIKEEVTRLRRQLNEIRHIFEEHLTSDQKQDWDNYVECLKSNCDNVNKMILKYNLTVPSLHKQFMGFQLEKEANKVLSKWDPEFHEICKVKANEKKKREQLAKSAPSPYSSGDTLLGSLMSIFKL